MEYFYVTRPDKSGKSLTTSYAKKSQAEKYGGGATPQKGCHYLNETGQRTEEETNKIFRSRLEGEAGSAMTGNFALYRQTPEGYVVTEFRAGTYSGANTLMKALAPVLGTLAVVEEVDGSEEDAGANSGPGSDESCPF